KCPCSAQGPTSRCVEKLTVRMVSIDAGDLLLPGAPTIDGTVDVATTANGPTEAVINKRCCGETNGTLGCLSQARLVPGLTSIRGLNDRGPGADQPTTVFIDKYSAEQKVPGGRLQTGPRCSRITSRIDRTGFSEGPTATMRAKHGAHQTSVDIDSFDVHTLPMFTAIGGPHQIGPWIFLALQLVDVYF